jgi:lysophospholipase L1-like esterase
VIFSVSQGLCNTTHMFAYGRIKPFKVLLATSFLSLPLQLCTADCFLSPSGLVGWWPAENNAKDIIGTNNGVSQGGATANATGFVGSAFSFDGTNGYIQVPDSSAFHPTNLTVEGWVRFSSLDSAGSGGSPPGHQYIIFKQNSRNSDFEGFDLSKTRAGNDFFRFTASSASGQSTQAVSTTAIAAGVWYHVAAVRGSNFIAIYVNGQLERQVAVGFAQDYGTLPLFFGTSGQSFWDHKFKGNLDEVSLYNCALSANEIAAIYAAGAAGKCKALAISSQPQSQTVPASSNVVFGVTVSGTSPLFYQWQRDSTNLTDSPTILGASSALLTLLNVQTNDSAGYRVVVTNVVGAITSSVASLFVDSELTPPSITLDPQSSTSYWGSSFTLTASASGAAPLRCQWRKNGAPIAGATNTSLSFPSLQLNNAGLYDIRVTNSYGAATSQSALLTIKVADLSITGATGPTPYMAGLNISGVTGQTYGIQVCSNLVSPVDWVGLTNLALPQPSYTWHDPSPTVQQQFYRVVPGPIPIGNSSWEAMPMEALVSDNFNRASLGADWVVLGDTTVSISANELLFNHATISLSRQVYYQPWQTCSDTWTIRWTERFGALNANSRGVGVGIKNFQTFGGNDREYNGLVCGASPDLGKMLLQRFDGAAQNLLASGAAMSLMAGDVLDCSFTRSGWTLTVSATNRANGQSSTASAIANSPPSLVRPTISRLCFYPLGGAVYIDDFSFTINHRKPARFVVIGASSCEGYYATTYEQGLVNVIQTNFTETVCNDSSSYNTTADALSVLPETLAHQPGTAILLIGGNDVHFGVPANQWQQQYSNLVAQLQSNGIKVKHCPVPRSSADLRPLRNWIMTSYPAGDIIDAWAPLVSGTYQLNPAYDSGDGVHPNDAGHLLIGQIIRANLP